MNPKIETKFVKVDWTENFDGALKISPKDNYI